MKQHTGPALQNVESHTKSRVTAVVQRFDRTSWLQRILANISNDTVGTMNIKHSNIKYKI